MTKISLYWLFKKITKEVLFPIQLSFFATKITAWRIKAIQSVILEMDDSMNN